MLIYLQVPLPERGFDIAFSEDDSEGNALDVDKAGLYIHFQSLHHLI